MYRGHTARGETLLQELLAPAFAFTTDVPIFPAPTAVDATRRATAEVGR